MTRTHTLQESNPLQPQLEAFALDLRQTYAAEKERAQQLAAALSELEQTYLATVRGLAVAVEAKDAYTAGHIVRVTRYGLRMMKPLLPNKQRIRSSSMGSCFTTSESS